MDGRFTKLSDDELKHLLFEAHRSPDAFEDDAKRQIREAAARRGFSAAEVERDFLRGERDDALHREHERSRKEAKQARFDLQYGRVLGGVGFLTALIIGVSSATAGHVGGMIAALATAGCSLWLILRRR